VRSEDGVAASDVIRSMMRMGFVRDEIYDVLTGVGLPGEQVQLLIDRVSAEFCDARLESRSSRLGTEVSEVFRGELAEVRHELVTQMNRLSRNLEFIKGELEKLGERIVKLQTLMTRVRTNIASSSGGTRHPRS